MHKTAPEQKGSNAENTILLPRHTLGHVFEMVLLKSSKLCRNISILNIQDPKMQTLFFIFSHQSVLFHKSISQTVLI